METEKENLTFGKILYKERIKSGRSQSDLARAVGLSRSTLCRYESEILKNPKRQVIMELAKALDISPAILFGEKSGDEADLLMLSNFKKLDEKTKFIIIELIQKIVDK